MRIHFLSVLSILLIGLFFGGCRDRNTSLVQVDKNALALAVAQADSLPPEKTLEIARALPEGAAQDSFFQKLVERKIAQSDTKALQTIGGFYQEVRGGSLGAEMFMAKIWGCADLFDGKYLAAEQWFQKGLALAEAARDTHQIIFHLKWLAKSNEQLGKVDQAMQRNVHAIQLLEATAADPLDIADLQLDMSYHLIHNKEYDKAIATANLAISAYQKAGDASSEAEANFILGTALEYKHDFPNAVVYYEKAIAFNKNPPIPPALTAIYGQCANLWLNYHDYPKAIKAVEAALFWNQKSPSRENDGNLESLLGYALYKNGDLAQGKKHLLASLEHGKQNQNASLENYANESLYRLCKTANQPAEALGYYEKFVAQKDTLHSREKQKTISELNIKYETAQKEKQLAEVENARKIEQFRAFAMVLSLLSALGLVLALFFRQRGRRRILESEKQLLESEQHLAEAREVLHLQELENTREHLQNTTQALEQSTALLNLKNEIIAQLKVKTPGDSRSDGSKSPDEAELNSLRKFRILTEMDWREFQEKYEHIFPGMLQRLHEHFPNITRAETRLFLLLKIGLVNSEIAVALGIGIESVWKSRQRLKKKLELVENSALDGFLRNF